VRPNESFEADAAAAPAARSSNRHQRRAAKARARLRRPEDAGLLYELVFVDQPEMFDLLLAAGSGDRRAAMIAHAGGEALIATSSAARTARPRVCLSCPREITDCSFSVALAVPNWHEPSRIIAAAVCQSCSASRDARHDKAVKAFRAILPDFRPLSPPPDLSRRSAQP
jgi:hypothetical protein